MSELMVIGFEGKYRAAEVLEQLQGLNPDWIDLEDAVAVYRTERGKLRVDGSVQPTTKEGAAAGLILGGLLGALLVAPFTAGASLGVAAAGVFSGALGLGVGGAVLGADEAAEWKKTYGISDEFVEQAGGTVQPGHSAIFVLANAPELAKVTEHFRGYGGKVLRTTLSPEAATKFQQLMSPPMATAR